MKEPKYRYIAYLRKSTEDEERQKLSRSAQKSKIKERFADLNIVDYLEESKSAFKPYQRPVFQKILDLIDAGKVDGIVAWHPDRISRNEIDASAITYRVRQGIIKDLKFASFTFDNSPEGMMMLQMTMSQSQYYSAKLSKDVRRGISHKVETGGVTGVAPEGYRNNSEKKIVYPDPLRYPLLRKAFDTFLTGEYSVQEVLKLLNEDWGYTTIKRKQIGGGPLTRSSLYRIFANIKYTGWIPDPYVPGKEHKAHFQPMITRDEYDRVQILLGDKGRPRLSVNKQFALRGFINCGECGCSVTAELKKKKLKNGRVNEHIYYHCTGKRLCKQRGCVTEADLYNQLNELIDDYEISPKLYEWGMSALVEMSNRESIERFDIQDMQHDSITGIEKQLDKLLDSLSKEFISNEEFKAKSDPLKKQLHQLQDEQADTADRAKNWYEIVGNTLKTLTSANEKFVEGDLNDKKEILLAIGKNPILMDKKLQITPNEWLIPIKREAKTIRREMSQVRTKLTDKEKASSEPQQIEEAKLKNSWLSMPV
jgi:site-specific DNA recombinase